MEVAFESIKLMLILYKSLIQNLFNALRKYYGLIGKEFSEEWTVEEVEECVRNLEEFNDKI